MEMFYISSLLDSIYWLFLLALIPAFIAKNKGRNFTTWYIYGVLIFIVALIHSLLISSKSEREQKLENGYFECPFCKELVRKGATVCPHCRRDISKEVTIPDNEIKSDTKEES